jgi:lipocalin
MTSKFNKPAAEWDQEIVGAWFEVARHPIRLCGGSEGSTSNCK